MIKKIILAPMLGITDQVFRTSFAKFFPGFDEAYAPFIKVNQFGEYKVNKMRELCPSLNHRLKTTPQLMCNQAQAFLLVSRQLAELGYDRVNWNLGCPSPSSSTRNLGCGLIPEIELVDRLLNDIFKELPISLSIKTRLGLNDPEEIFKLSDVLNRYPINHVIVHPRTGVQGYRGEVNLEAFDEVIKRLRMPVLLSGDIHSPLTWEAMTARYPEVEGFLIGRGALSDPHIACSIKKIPIPSHHLTPEYYGMFLTELWAGYVKQGISPKDINFKARTLFYYLSKSMDFSPRQLRKLRKSQNLSDYLAILESVACQQ